VAPGAGDRLEARRGQSHGLEAPFVGRESELRLVKDLFHATSEEWRARLVSIVGIAGIGKWPARQEPLDVDRTT
jgi:hypothetical protein